VNNEVTNSNMSEQGRQQLRMTISTEAGCCSPHPVAYGSAAGAAYIREDERAMDALSRR